MDVGVGGGRCKERQGMQKKMKGLLAASIAVIGCSGFRKGVFFLFFFLLRPDNSKI